MPVHDVQRNIESSHVEGNKVGQLHKQTMHGGVSEVFSTQEALGHFTLWSRSPTFRQPSQPDTQTQSYCDSCYRFMRKTQQIRFQV